MSKKIAIKKLISNEDNPRYIGEAKFKKLVKSIQDFPEMLEKRPIIVDENFVVLGGNMRLKACLKAGFTEVWFEQVKDWTEEQKKQFIIKDNVGFGDWDWDILGNKWVAGDLQDWGLDVPNWETDIEFADDDDIDDEFDYPDDIEKSHVRMIQLFFNDKTEPIFKQLELKARKELDTDNVTDSVFKLFKQVYGKDS
jgi:hypothetical protein|tara:strand:- start:479 stop:1066 length:588 start_codon:yes stop_codon:yes gene_type:complete